MTDYIKNKIESQRKIQAQIEIEHRSRRLLPDVDNHLNKEYVDKMTKEQKTSVNIELDPELLEKIDREAAKDLRTRKAQVMYIISQYYLNNNELEILRMAIKSPDPQAMYFRYLETRANDKRTKEEK